MSIFQYGVNRAYALLIFLLLGVHNPLWSATTLNKTVVSDVAPVSSSQAQECVIALHGLARTARSMEKMSLALIESGYAVANIDYPSRERTVQELASPTIKQGLDSCDEQGAKIVHFVTHSMGGILVRQYLSENIMGNLGRVVMLAPPNKGSEVVDALGDVPGYEFLNGPAGMQLGTDQRSVPLMLGPADFDLGIIAGTRSINLLLSTLLPNSDDGKVSVARTQIEGMCDFLVLDVTHTFIMKNDKVIDQVLHYLQNGRFSKTEETDTNRHQRIQTQRPAQCQ